MTQRSRAYSEAIRKHDAKKKKGADDAAPLGHLIVDSGAQSHQLLTSTNLPIADINLIINTVNQFTEATKTDVGIHPKEQLVVYMDDLDA